MKEEAYLQYVLRGDPEPVTRDGHGYWVIVEPKVSMSESARLFTEVTFITGTAITLKYGDRRADPIPYLEELTFSKVRARIALGLFESGKEYLQEISSETLRSQVRPVEGNVVQRYLLAGLLNIRKSNPLKYKFEMLDVEGFCNILAIGRNDYLFYASLLLEDGLVERSPLDQLSIENGGLHITSKGVRLAESPTLRPTEQPPTQSKVTLKVEPAPTEQKYDVAISFAGEDRTAAETIANGLREKNVRVFYDAFEEDALWGKNLYEYLTKIYTDEARFCILLISKHYAIKSWATLERQSAQARAFREGREYILPIRLDETQIPGLPETVGYVTYDEAKIEKIVEMVIKKLSKLGEQ